MQDAQSRPRRADEGRGRPALAGPAPARPDRLALWAVVLGLFLALLAAATARGEDEGAVGGAESRAAQTAPAVAVTAP